MFGFFDLLQAQEARTARRETQRDNAARLAFSVHRQTSTGVGYFKQTKAFSFDVVFTEAPALLSGSAILNMPDEPWLPPAAGASVWQWKRNVKGHYTGAWVSLWVQIESRNGTLASPPAVKVQHHLMFLGQAYKDLGDEVATQAQLLAPRTTGFGS